MLENRGAKMRHSLSLGLQYAGGKRLPISNLDFPISGAGTGLI